MKKVVAAAALFAGLLPSVAHPQNKASSPPPDVKKTVEAFAGHWIITGTDAEPGAKAPANFTLTLDCRRTAFGAAVDCRFAGQLPGAGPIEASAVIGYSPDEQVVRWMEISSTGEYHDHRGRWSGTELGFEPLEFAISGERATEYLRVAFPANGKLTLNSVTETAGGKSVLECAGRRATTTARH